MYIKNMPKIELHEVNRFTLGCEKLLKEIW